jgi:hypothetical protein
MLKASVDVSNGYLFVTYQDKKMFVGVNVIEGIRSSRFITLDGGSVCSIHIYNQLIYLLVGIWTVKVYRLDGQFVQSWKHEDSSNTINKLLSSTTKSTYRVDLIKKSSVRLSVETEQTMMLT